MDANKTLVIFRIWPKEKDVIALFPAIDEGNGKCLSYQHLGQHGGADYKIVIAATNRASHEQYHNLATELESIGYNLEIRQRYIR